MKKKERYSKKAVILFLLVICIVTSKNILAQAGFVTPAGTDNTTIPIYVHGAPGNGVYIGRGNGASNANSTAVGRLALSATITNASDNTALGSYALNTTTGSFNIGVGSQSLQNNTSGSNNTAVGFRTLFSNTVGAANTAIGATALTNLNGIVGSADTNTAVGINAMYSLTSGKCNVGVGYGATGWLQTGNNNVGLGTGALSGLNSGNGNVAIGYYASVTNAANDQLSIQNVIYGTNMGATGTGKIGIGLNNPSEQLHTNAGVRFQGLTTSSSATSIVGIDASGKLWKMSSCASSGNIPRNNDVNGNMTCSQVYDNGITTSIGYGSAATLTWTSGGAQFGLAGDNITNPTNYKLYVAGWTRAQGYIATSDQRLKKDIKKIESALEKISKLNGYTYNWKNEDKAVGDIDKNKQAGFLAQEVEKVMPEAVVINSDGIYGLNYNAIMPLLSEGIKAQQEEIKTQQLKIENLELQVTVLRNKLNQLVPGDVKIKVNSLEVVPNPITGISVVSYKLDNSNAAAFLIVSDLQGRLLKQVSLPKNQQQGQVQVSKSDLPSGMYVFAIVSGNTEVQSKKVLVSASE